MSIAKDKDPSIRVKMNQTFFFIFITFALYLLSGCDLFNMSRLSQIFLMASLDILCSNHLNLKNKITKIELRKIFCSPWKILKNIPWPINICQKYFIAPTKSPPFIYLMNGPLALPGVILPLKIL